MTTYDTVLFDWDGCLIQTHQLWVDVYLSELARYSLILTPHSIVENAGNWEYFSSLGIVDVLEFRKSINSAIAKIYGSAKLYPDAKWLLKSLSRRGIKIGIVSNSANADIEPMLVSCGIKSYISILVGGDDVEKHKPAPDPVLSALRGLGSRSHSTLMVGDSSKDIEAAKSAGVDSVLVYPTDHADYFDENILRSSDPTYTVGCLRELATLV